MALTQYTDGTTRPGEGGHDAPITSADEDHFGALAVARAVHRTIRAAPRGWSTRIGLYGAWGSGKTSILNLLESLEKSDSSIVVRFSAWSAIGEAGVLALFYEALAHDLKRENINQPLRSQTKQVVTKARPLGKFLRGIGRGAEITQQIPQGVTDLVSEAASFAAGWLAINKQDIQALVKQLNGRRVVVFIDDLDRADPRVVPKTLLALRELLDWPGFSFVLAFDKGVIAKALGEYSNAYGDNAHVFLEKVVDVPFEVPTPTNLQKQALATHAFAACCSFIPTETVQAIAIFLPDEPRRIKLIARNLGVLASVADRHGTEEVDWTGIAFYNIVHEASSEAAAWLTNAVTDDTAGWELWLGDAKEREKRESQARAELLERINKAGQPVAVDRTVSAAIVLLNRWSQETPEKVRYWLNLVLNEPTFTLKEYRSLINEWFIDRDDRVIADAVEAAAQRAATSQLEASHHFIKLAIDNHNNVLQAMADAETELQFLELARQASDTLSVLEFVWTICAVGGVQQARKTGEATAALISMTSRWIGWVRNPGEGDLRKREREIAMTAAQMCVDKARLYSDTDPYWNRGRSFQDAESAAISDAWRDALRAALIGPITEDLLKRFLKPDGLLTTARGDYELGTWLLESHKSPFYNDPSLALKLQNVFALDGAAHERISIVLRENAKLYLHMLLFQVRDASWGGLESLKAIHARFPRIVPAAWGVVARSPVPFRMVSSIQKLRNDLIDAGVSQELLVEPEWMKQAIVRLADTKNTKAAEGILAGNASLRATGEPSKREGGE